MLRSVLHVFVSTLFVLCGLGSVAQADVRALLIGVSDYEDGSGIPDLRGPANDVTLMQSVLEARGATDIVTIADGVEGAVRPTLAAIEAGFAEITSRTEAGDLVYIHLSGHGTRQHDLEGDETDGLDEVFLPADVTKSAGGQTIPNALTDDRIGELIRAIRAKKATVWLVMDSCHSGSGMRNLSDVVAERHVDEKALGIGPAPEKTNAGTSPASEAPDEELGSYIAFYATRSNDVAREANLSKGEGEEAWYGLFTSAIAARLESGQALSYRQLFQSVLSDLTGGSRFGAAAIQTPLWEGDLIDASVFGGKNSVGVQRYLTSGDEVQAGLVHGLRVGSLVALVDDITNDPDDVLGYAQVEEAQARISYIRPVDAGCIPNAGSLCPYAGSLPEAARFAQVELHPGDQKIRFAPVLDAQTEEPLPEDHPVMMALQGAISRASEASGIQAEINSDTFVVTSILREKGLWFGPVTRIGDEPAGLEVAYEQAVTADMLYEPVLRILRAETLVQTLELLDLGASFASPQPVTIEASQFQSNLADIRKPGEPVNTLRECRQTFEKAAQAEFEPMEKSSDFKQCDVLYFQAKGKPDAQVDVNRIHIDTQYCISVTYELVEGDDAVRDLNKAGFVCSDCQTGAEEPTYSAGHERMFFLMSRLQEKTEALNLTGLIENCVGGAGGTRSARSAAVQSMLGQVARSGNTRGLTGMSLGGAVSSVWVESYRWRVLPKSEAFGDLSVTQ